MATYGAHVPHLLALALGCLGVATPVTAQVVRADPEMPFEATMQLGDRLCV